LPSVNKSNTYAITSIVIVISISIVITQTIYNSMSSPKPLLIRGRAKVVPVADVDTDMIFHNRYLHIIQTAEMGKYIFGNLKGYEQFPQVVRPGDILIVGHNFGCGSSRQQAVDGFIALGLAAVIGASFGAIYKRNAVNAGWPLIECQSILHSGIIDDMEVEVDLTTGEVRKPGGGLLTKGKALTQVQKDIYFAGGLLELAVIQR